MLKLPLHGKMFFSYFLNANPQLHMLNLHRIKPRHIIFLLLLLSLPLQLFQCKPRPKKTNVSSLLFGIFNKLLCSYNKNCHKQGKDNKHITVYSIKRFSAPNFNFTSHVPFGKCIPVLFFYNI